MINSIRAFFLGLLMFSVAINPVLAVDTAALLPNAVQQFFDNNGNPLTKGTVTTYDAGTSTLRTTWKDSAEALPNTNPIILDAGGKAIIYGSGNYRQVVKDRNGNLIWDAVTAPGGGGSSPTDVGDGNLVGTILPWSGLTAPNQYVFTYGQEIARATYPEYFTAVTQQLNVICSSASNILTGLADTSQVKIGSAIELSLCVAAGTTVSAKTAATITLSNPSSVSINAVATFFPWGNGNGSTTFNVPDLRGIVPIGRDNMGGSSANRITTANCGNGITPDALGAFCNSNPGGGHTNTVAELAAHTHTATTVITYNGLVSPSVALGAINALDTFTGAGSATPTSVPSNTTITGATTNTITGSNVPFSVVPPSLTINYIAKVTPDTSTSIATGVFSIGGMSGVIACGTGILCTGNIISWDGSSLAGGLNGNVQYSNSGVLAGSPNFTFISPDNLTLGAAGTSFKFDIFGSTSGRVRQTVPAVAGTTAVAWGNSSGTPAVTATSPLTINTTTGNITCTTCVTPSSVNAVTNSNLSQAGAATFKGNPTAALANIQDFTVASLTQTISPTALDFIPIFDNSTGTIKKINAGSIASSATAGVASINGNTGAFTLNSTSGLTNTVNDVKCFPATSAQFGCIKVDNITITAAAGIISTNLTPITNSLSGDVALNNTGNYFDGPSIAQGTSGTWLATGQVTVTDTGSYTISCKLWDGTTVIASGSMSNNATFFSQFGLSGYITSPAANIKISCRDSSATSGSIKFNASGNSKDSTVSAIRIQ